MPNKIWNMFLYVLLMLSILILFYLLCCKCIFVGHFDRNLQIRDMYLETERNRREIEIQRQINMDILQQTIMVQELGKRYIEKYGDDGEEMEEDKEHVIIVGPNGNQISLGKKITDS